jgi:hypothetical protein
MALDRAYSNVRFSFGKYKDHLVHNIVQGDPGYVVWFFENVEGAERYVTVGQYNEAQDGVEHWESLRDELEGLGGSPEWWKD